MEGGMLGATDFAKALRVTRGTVQNYVRTGQVLWIPKGSSQREYPAWQVHEHALLPHLEVILFKLRAISVSPTAAVRFFLMPRGLLNGRRVLDVLRNGTEREQEKALALATRNGEI
jgi:hypothetical protein